MNKMMDLIIPGQPYVPNPNNPVVIQLEQPFNYLEINYWALGIVLITIGFVLFFYVFRHELLQNKFDFKNKKRKITALAIGHLLVDLQGIYLIKNTPNIVTVEKVIIYFLLYNLIAFGFQMVIGYIADLKQRYVPLIIVGFMLPMVALQMGETFLLAVIVTALGNAMYHVGGGVVSVNMFEGKAAPAGVFVAPGALGVFLGGFLLTIEHNSILYISIATVLLLITLFVLFVNHKEEYEYKQVKEEFIYIILLVFAIVFLRGYIGLNLQLPWKSDYSLAFVLTLGVFIGKFAGGFLGDRFGYKKIGLIGLLASLPFLLFGFEIPLLGMIGALLFNFTMAITLFLIIDSLGNFKGFAFGITTFALFISYLPGAILYDFEMGTAYIIMIIVATLLASISLYKLVDIYKK